MPILETSRFILRPFEESDFEAVHEYASDPVVTRYQSWGPNDQDATREFLRTSRENFDFEAGDDLEFAIVARGSWRVIGGCGFHARRKQFREFETGWTLRRDAWRKGIATECISALIALLFAERSAHRLYALIDVENVGSIALAEKLGFRREGHQVRDSLVRGEWRDTYVYARLGEG